jgi:hypothetical protein
LTLLSKAKTMQEPDDTADSPSKDLLRALQEELRPIEPAAQVKEAMLERILNRTVRTVRSWRDWLNQPNNRMDD